jgi:hypothetical protein
MIHENEQEPRQLKRHMRQDPPTGKVNTHHTGLYPVGNYASGFYMMHIHFTEYMDGDVRSLPVQQPYYVCSN